MKLNEVLSKSDEQAFIQVHILINKNNPNWIRPLDKDVLSIFDPKQNKYLLNG
jgi:hypothetical protein